MGDVTEFGAFAQEDDSPVVTWPGAPRKWELPHHGEILAATMAKVAHMRVQAGRLTAGMADDDEVPAELWDAMEVIQSPLRMLRMLLGDELVDEWEEAGIPERAADQLSHTCLRYYESGKWEPELFQGDGDPPTNRAQRRAAKKTTAKKASGSGGKKSSKASASSKRTASASTAST